MQEHLYIFTDHSGFDGSKIGVLRFKSNTGNGMQDLKEAIEGWTDGITDDDLPDVNMEKVMGRELTFHDLHDGAYTTYLEDYGIESLQALYFDSKHSTYNINATL